MAQCGTGSTGNLLVFTKVNTPEQSKIKYINAGLLNTSLVLNDGTVWQTGFNGSGELGNGTDADSLTFAQGSTKEDLLQEVLIVRKEYAVM